MSHVDHEPLKERTSRELYFPSAFPDLSALLFTPPSDEASEKRCPAFQKSRTQGLATLSTVSAPLDPWKPLSAPNAPGIRPSELCSFSMIKSTFPVNSLRSCASLENLPASYRRSSGFLPWKKPCPFSLPGGLVRVGTFALLSFRASQALSSLSPKIERLPLPLPLSSFHEASSRTPHPEPQGF